MGWNGTILGLSGWAQNNVVCVYEQPEVCVEWFHLDPWSKCVVLRVEGWEIEWKNDFIQLKWNTVILHAEWRDSFVTVGQNDVITNKRVSVLDTIVHSSGGTSRSTKISGV